MSRLQPAPFARLATVSDGNNNGATYSYVVNSPLVGQIVFKRNGTLAMTTTKQYDFLNRLTQVGSQPAGTGAAPISFNYGYNTANQRTQDKLADGSYWVYSYDALGQVTGGHKYFYDSTPVPGQQFDYAFDTIGNRTQTKAGGDETGGNQRLASYTANTLNQITSRDYPGTNDVVGVALATNGVTVNGQAAWRKGEYFWSPLNLTNSVAPKWVAANVASAGYTASGAVYAPWTPEHFSYDADGNLTNDGRWAYTRDAENRLIKMTVNTNVGPQYQLSFAYDAQGRRIQKLVATNNGAAYVGQYTNRFLYDGWNVMTTLNPQSAIVQSFTWGSDLSGSMQGAGGVGGLLAVSYHGTATTNCFPAYDGNGNVAALINAADGTLTASYEYGPFGEVIRATGPMAKANPFRFSTIYQDDESDLLMYVHRPYKASTGTWLCKDPLGDAAFFLDQIKKEKTARSQKHLTEQANLPSYLFVCNDPESKIDLLGLNPTYTWGPVSNCKQGDKEAFIQVWLGGSLSGGSGVDDGTDGRGSTKPNCPPLYPGSIGGAFTDAPGWSLGVFGIGGGTWGINGEKVEVCHVCLQKCTGSQLNTIMGRNGINGAYVTCYSGYKIVKIGPCMSYTISSDSDDLNDIGKSSDSPSAGFSQMVNSSFPGVLGGGCIKCANPN